VRIRGCIPSGRILVIHFLIKKFIELKIVRVIVKKINCYKPSNNKTSNKYNYLLLLANCDIETREKKHISIVQFNIAENRNSNKFFSHTFLQNLSNNNVIRDIWQGISVTLSA